MTYPPPVGPFSKTVARFVQGVTHMTKRERIEALEQEVRDLHARVAKLEKGIPAMPIRSDSTGQVAVTPKAVEAYRDLHDGCRGCQLCEPWRCQD